MKRFPLRPLRVAARAAAILIVAAAPAGAATIHVGLDGPGAGCEASTIEGAVAIAAATSESDEIRIDSSGGTIYTLSSSLNLTNWGPGGHGALVISGGWDSCTDTTPGSTQAWIFWSGPGPVVEVDTTAGQTSLVTLRRVHLTGLASSSTARGLEARGDSTVVLEDARLSENGSGGIEVSGGAFVFVDESTTVHANGPTAEGGGIRCLGAESLLRVDGVVGDNEATLGGGIFADSGCEVLLGGTSRIEYNQATVGGGLYAEGGAVVAALGGTWIAENEAISSGGGVAASGAGTSVELDGTHLSFNRARFTGAGIFVTASATVTTDAGTCAGGPSCRSGLYANELAIGAREGAAATVYNGGELRLYQTAVAYNIVPQAEPSGSVLHAAGADATILTESAEVAFNSGADAVFQGESGATIGVAFTTVGYNSYATPGGALEARGLRIEDTGTSARINTSIFYPTAGYLVGSGAALTQVDCLLTSTVAGLAGGDFVHVLDPRYTNPGDGDLRPQPGSPAIDFCDTFAYVPTQADLDGRARGHDHPTDPNGSPGPSAGTQDAGAYELWELFADGFATGDTSRWSSATP